jgi:2-amino-4-hydroxy-6-hydroxymethyldihydropteridine diphosphokinase
MALDNVDMNVPARHRAIVALGSNLGDRVAYLRFGLERLSNVIAQSQVFETDPVGGPDNQGPYLNMVVVVDTDLDPFAMLRRLLQIEAEANRVRIQRWGPRTLDLDLLFYDDYTIQSEELTVPHPRFAERRFVLEPLSEVALEHCPSHWRDRLPDYGVYPRGPLDSMVAHISFS